MKIRIPPAEYYYYFVDKKLLQTAVCFIIKNLLNSTT